MMSCSKTPIFFGANLFRSFLIDPEWEKWHDAELPGFRTTAEGGQHFLRGWNQLENAARTRPNINSKCQNAHAIWNPKCFFCSRPKKWCPEIWQHSKNACMYVCMHVRMYVSTYVPIYLSTYLPIYLCTYLPIYLSTYLPIYLSTYLPIYLSTYLPIYLSIYLSIYVSIALCMYASMCPCMYVSMYLCICVSMYLCIYVSMYLCIYAKLPYFLPKGLGSATIQHVLHECYASWFVQSSLHMGHAVSHTFDVSHSSLGLWAIVVHWSILKHAWPKSENPSLHC